MDDSNSHYYAWIPTLTNGISIEKGFETVLDEYKEESFHTYTGKKPHIEKDIKDGKERKFDRKIILDVDKKIKQIQIFDYENKRIGGGNIKFFSNLYNTLTGLIEIYDLDIDKNYVKTIISDIKEREDIKKLPSYLFLNEKYIEKNLKTLLIREIYVCVRDVYHKHTHHDDSHDLHLNVIEASDTKDAIEKIIKQFENKANEHILRMNDIYKNYKNKEKSLSEAGWYDRFILATGEMIYAQRFIELHEDKLPASKEYLISQFKHGETTLNAHKEVINEEIESQRKEIEVQRNEEILKLTFIGTMMGVIGAIIGIILSLDALHNLGVSWLIMLITMLTISILIVLTLGVLLIKSIESRILKLLKKNLA